MPGFAHPAQQPPLDDCSIFTRSWLTNGPLICETWSQQNRTISPEFIRTIRDRPVAHLIATQKPFLQAQVCLRGMRIGEQPNPTALEEWERRMDGLATRWNSKLEADAVACEYRASKNEISNSARADSAKEAATDVPDLLNEPAGMQSPGERPDRMVKTEKLPTTAEAISKQLLTEVTSLLKKCRMRRFENVEGLVEAHEWQRLTRLFHRAGERYAMASFREGRSRLEWSRKNIESDGQSIHQQHAQHFCLLQSRRSDLGIDNVLRVFETKLDFAMSEAMCAAAVCIDGSELPSPTLKTPRSKSDRLLSSYRSEIKRAILTQLALKPKATDVEICRGLDADGSVELPSRWKSKLHLRAPSLLSV